MAWLVVYTKPRQEKKVVAALEQLGISVYCPMVTTVKQWSDRKKKITTPLMASYVLVQIEEKDRLTVLEVSGVVRFLFWLGKPAVVQDQEVETLRNWMNEKDATVRMLPWQPGTKVVLTTGVFKGQEAVVQSIKSNKVEMVLTSLGVKLTLERANILA